MEYQWHHQSISLLAYHVRCIYCSVEPLLFFNAALSAVITTRGQLHEGQAYSLTCDVRGDEQLQPISRRFRWDKVVVGSTDIILSREPTLMFSNLQRTDTGTYRCTSIFGSSHFSDGGTRTVRATSMIRVFREYYQCQKFDLCNVMM